MLQYNCTLLDRRGLCKKLESLESLEHFVTLFALQLQFNRARDLYEKAREAHRAYQSAINKLSAGEATLTNLESSVILDEIEEGSQNLMYKTAESFAHQREMQQALETEYCQEQLEEYRLSTKTAPQEIPIDLEERLNEIMLIRYKKGQQFNSTSDLILMLNHQIQVENQ